MSFKNQLNAKKDLIDEVQRLMCSVPGCSRRWSVHMEGHRPMCSEHQWAGSKPKRNITDFLPNKPVKHWTDDGEMF